MKILIVNCETNEESLVDVDAEQAAAHDVSAIESAWALLRAERSAKLAESDWTVLADTPTPTAAWKTYRQALRDLPANTTDPFNPVWPTPPS